MISKNKTAKRTATVSRIVGIDDTVGFTLVYFSDLSSSSFLYPLSAYLSYLWQFLDDFLGPGWLPMA